MSTTNSTNFSPPSLAQIVAERTPDGGRLAFQESVLDPDGRPGTASQQHSQRPRLAGSERMAETRDEVNAVLEHLDVQLELSVNRELDRVVAKVVRRGTGEVVREIPPEEMLEMAKRLEEMSGLLLDERR
jgi:flagellar protein FlaG